MGRRPCCEKEGVNRGAWTAMEDKLLIDYVHLHGEGQWRSLPKKAGLKRCGKSCRLRWLNYLRPDIKRGNITADEDELIIRLHKLLGNRWSLIAGRLPGRIDNEIKNYWNTNLSKRIQNQSNSCKNHTKQNGISTNSNLVFTKAVKCTRVIMPPVLSHQPPPPRSLDQIQDLPSLDFPATDDFNMSFSEFLDSQQLSMPEFCPKFDGSDELSSPKEPINGFSEDMTEDWVGNECIFDDIDASLLVLQNWLGV